MPAPLTTFDIWDTCLVRVAAAPHDVFYAVAAQVLGGSDWADARVAGLAQARIAAESAARRAAPAAECTFEEIRAQLARLTDATTAEKFAAAELAAERAGVRPVRAIAAELAAVRARGERVAFVSDMYLPSAFLHTLLADHGLARADERVFVSCEHRANKHGGGLFDVVARELGATPAAWTHHGDHPHSDTAVPAARGIAARHFTRGATTAVERTVRERLADRPRAASVLHGAIRAARLALDPAMPGDRAALLSGVAAPWLCALAWRTVRRASAAGIKRLHFLSRDAEVLLRVARRFAPAGLDCHYLYSSRRAWCRAAMLADDEASWRWLQVGSPSPLALLRSLGFDETERTAHLAALGLAPAEAARSRPAADLGFVWDHLHRTGALAAVLARAAAERTTLLAYLDREGLPGGAPAAIVDVGWSLNSQAALNRVLRSAGATRDVAGFYFMARQNRPPLAETGPFDTWLLEDLCGGDRASTGALFTWQSGLIEEFFLANADPSLAGFRATPAGGAEPEFAAESPDAATVAHAAGLRAAAEALADQLAPWRDDAAIAEALETQALAELIRFLRAPTAAEAGVLASFAHATDATGSSAEARPLARPYRLGDAAAILLRRAKLRRGGIAREPLWPEGSLALTGGIARKAMNFATQPLRRR